MNGPNNPSACPWNNRAVPPKAKPSKREASLKAMLDVVVEHVSISSENLSREGKCEEHYKNARTQGKAECTRPIPSEDAGDGSQQTTQPPRGEPQTYPSAAYAIWTNKSQMNKENGNEEQCG
jgi:hypothetical protein